MKNCLVPVLMLMWLAACSPATSAEFSPLFTVTDVSGTATVQVPGSKTAVPLEAGQAYPYGSIFRTDSDSSVKVEFSEGNSATIHGDATVDVNQDSADGGIKVLHMHSGKVDFKLEEGFEANNGFQVFTRCCSIVALKGGSSSVDAKAEGELKVTVIKVNKGELEASGPSYDIALLTDNDAITIACSNDRTFVRLRDLNGNYGIEIDDEDGGKRLVEMEKDAVIKILRKPSDVDSNIMIVTVLEIDRDGNIVSATTFSVVGGEDWYAGRGDPAPPPAATTPSEPTVGTGITPGSVDVEEEEATSPTATGVPPPPTTVVPPPTLARPKPPETPSVTPPGGE